MEAAREVQEEAVAQAYLVLGAEEEGRPCLVAEVEAAVRPCLVVEVEAEAVVRPFLALAVAEVDRAYLGVVEVAVVQAFLALGVEEVGRAYLVVEEVEAALTCLALVAEEVVQAYLVEAVEEVRLHSESVQQQRSFAEQVQVLLVSPSFPVLQTFA